MRVAIVALILLASSCSSPNDVRSPDAVPHADAGPGVYIVNLEDGDVVSSPFRVVFGLYGMGVAPAGVAKENTGHHHLIIDEVLEGEELDFAVPADENHIHFGGGQTEVTLTLPAGEHTLSLVLGDLNHVPLKPSVQSKPITITVR